MKLALALIAASLCFSDILAQVTLKGMVADSLTGRPIISASIKSVGTMSGTTTDIHGRFSIRVDKPRIILSIISLGYAPKQVSVDTGEGEVKDLGIILLKGKSTALQGVQIISSYARERITPIAMTTLKGEMLQRESANLTIPETFRMVPGVYATREGGGSGDARLSIRGFKQENVALLLNGIPVSSMETGQVYWSNWFGLDDVAQAVQVQKGLGASSVAMNSVGGTVNIITHTTSAEEGGHTGFSVSDYGNYTFDLSLSTGKLQNGYAVSFQGSRSRGPGYVDATYVDAWTYFLSVSKEINHRHKILFVGLGAPQVHGQSQYKMSFKEQEKYGNTFNYGWGSYNGKINNQTENFYHNPNFNLSHYWTINSKSFLATSAYYTIGKGGGKWTESFDNSPSVFEYRNESNQIDWDAIYTNNARHNDSAQLADGSYVKGYSKNIQSDFLADNYWVGILSTLKHNFNDNWHLTSGIHGRNFRARLHEEVKDLLGGKFWIEDYAWAIEGIGDRRQIMKKGDIIKVDNTAHINYLSVFGQIEFHNGALSSFIAGNVSSSHYRREDDYNYLSNTLSDVVSLNGFDVRAGANYNISQNHNVYLNLGYFSKQPYYTFVFVNFSNTVAENLTNEKISAIETGYGFNSGIFNARLNVYHTYWKDKSFLSNENILLLDSTQTRAMVKGLNARHRGVELEFDANPIECVKLGGVFSLGDWRWKSNVGAQLYNENNVLVDTVEVYSDGLYVGDAPQTQLGIFGELLVLKRFSIRLKWYYYDRLYADFDPSTRNDPGDREQPYELPSYHMLDMYLGYNLEMFRKKAYFQVSCMNLLDVVTPIRGEDGPEHDKEGFKGFWSFGRTFNVMLRLDI